MNSKILLVATGFLVACQSSPYDHVQVANGYPQGRRCREIGQVIGNAHSRENAHDQAIDDLKYQAAQREGNYVRLIAVAAYGSSARGVAYKCN